MQRSGSPVRKFLVTFFSLLRTRYQIGKLGTSHSVLKYFRFCQRKREPGTTHPAREYLHLCSFIGSIFSFGIWTWGDLGGTNCLCPQHYYFLVHYTFGYALSIPAHCLGFSECVNTLLHSAIHLNFFFSFELGLIQLPFDTVNENNTIQAWQSSIWTETGSQDMVLTTN